MPPGITQPVIALAFCPVAHPVATYTPNAVGMKGLLSATGVWLFTFDTPQVGNKVVVNATIEGVATQMAAVVSMNGLQADGKVTGFAVTTLLAGVATDSGLMVSVSGMPDID